MSEMVVSSESRPIPYWTLLLCFAVQMLAMVAFAFCFLDLIRLAIESRSPGPYDLYMPDDPRVNFYSRVVGIESIFYTFLCQWRHLILLVGGIITLSLAVRFRLRLRFFQTTFIAYGLIILGDILLAVHYHLGL